jgi:primosomal protein N'
MGCCVTPAAISARCPNAVPNAGGQQIRQLGTGTEKVEHKVRERFPGARTLRWDAETTRKKGAHERILTQFTRHQGRISLIGTQMLAKGLDLPLVTLVGVVLAEVGLNLPDYRAAERTFQVLTQVAGRAGRSPLGGRVILSKPINLTITPSKPQRTMIMKPSMRRRWLTGASCATRLFHPVGQVRIPPS